MDEEEEFVISPVARTVVVEVDGIMVIRIDVPAFDENGYSIPGEFDSMFLTPDAARGLHNQLDLATRYIVDKKIRTNINLN